MTETKQNSGGSVNLTPRFYWGVAVGALTTASVGNSSATGTAPRSIIAIRLGTDIYFTTNPVTGGISTGLVTNNFTTSAGVVLPGVSFAADTIFKVTLQWATAGSTIFYRVKMARATKR